MQVVDDPNDVPSLQFLSSAGHTYTFLLMQLIHRHRSFLELDHSEAVERLRLAVTCLLWPSIIKGYLIIVLQSMPVGELRTNSSGPKHRCTMASKT